MITEKILLESLNEVITKKNKVIVIYSGLWTFINKIKFKNQNISKTILNLIEKFIGKNRTLIVPSFSSESFLRSKKFDLKKTIDKNNGIISLEAFNKNYYRTPQPLHSYLVFGKEIKEIKKLKFKTSWGYSSILGYMSKKNARICTLGLPWNQGCAYLHSYEEKYHVPWRYYKKFEGVMYSNGVKIGTYKEVKYSSPKNGILNYDFFPLISKIKKSNSFKKNSSKEFTFESIETKCLDNIGKIFFSKNPWMIVKNKKEVNNWIKKEKQIEEDEIRLQENEREKQTARGAINFS